jgi:oxygen-independent coproporphyrinogen-3 oxidase
MQRYVDALQVELNLRSCSLVGERIDTIYWGGGTPSQLTTNMMSEVFRVIYEKYNVSEIAEITLEANPDDLSVEYLEALSQLPFNRISIGIQSFCDHELSMLNRRHTAEDAILAVERCRTVADIHNISIDLMYGLPEQSLEIWSRSLDMALSLGVQHISAYHLTYEKGTALYDRLVRGNVAEPDQELSLSMFELLRSRLLDAGFLHYEISNFAIPGFLSQHNSSYWSGVSYLGVGASAHSLVEGARSWNVSDMKLYIAQAESGCFTPDFDDCDEYTRYNDFVITTLRTSNGMSLRLLEEKFGVELLNYCLSEASTFLKNGSLVQREDTLFLSDTALFLSDSIMSTLLYVAD